MYEWTVLDSTVALQLRGSQLDVPYVGERLVATRHELQLITARKRIVVHDIPLREFTAAQTQTPSVREVISRISGDNAPFRRNSSCLAAR